MIFPYAAIWTVNGQALLRSADDVIANIEEKEEEFWVWGYFSLLPANAAGTPASSSKQIRIVVTSPEQVEQIRLAVKQARGLSYDWKVQRMPSVVAMV
jgi:hypothetical protein